MYRILSATAILGYGFPESSFARAMAFDLDLIAVDAGSMDAGPYYLGARAQYVGLSALRRDLELLVAGSLQQGCSLIVGSAGFSGGDTQLRETVALVRQIVEQKASAEVTLAVIPSGVTPQAIAPVLDALTPLGQMPPLTPEALQQSEIVAQMGTEPIITALDHGAQIILCGRAYDPAVFAADPIRQGYPPGVALHAAKILECGAIACEPGSGSDCLIAELTRDGVATFRPTNPERRATVLSIAAHTLYEKPRPDLFHLPGGVLSIRDSHFKAVEGSAVSVEGSTFHPVPYSVKLEGCRRVGHRVVSIIPLTTGEEAFGADVRVYGRNGVEEQPVAGPITEVGIVVAVTSADVQTVKDALAFLRSTMLHFGYAGRVSTAGNLAFPFSPSDLFPAQQNGCFTALFVAGSRDPVLQQQLPQIIAGVRAALQEQHPELHAATQILIETGDGCRPLGVVETVRDEPSVARSEHKKLLHQLTDRIDRSRPAFCNIEVGDVYVWSLHHLLHDLKIIGELFPVELSKLRGGEWVASGRVSADYSRACATPEPVIDEGGANLEDRPMAGAGSKRTPLIDLAKVIRSKNAGINEITYDILFKTREAYEVALASGEFGPRGVAAALGIDPERVIGSYRYDPALAIKFTVRRDLLCGSPGDRDVFGAQQHARLQQLQVCG